MSAYYNEIDPYAARWLKHLILDGLIAPGEVDERSIEDVRPSELAGFTQCHFFAGLGGWSYALRLAGWPDDRPIWTGSCPCQPFSAAGKGKGFADERHLWPSWFHLIRLLRPQFIVGEQVASNLAWLDLVQTDLEGEGYASRAAIIGAHSVGAPHIRQRLYWVANTSQHGSGPLDWQSRSSFRSEESTRGRSVSGELADHHYLGCEGQRSTELSDDQRQHGQGASQRYYANGRCATRDFCEYCGAGIGAAAKYREGRCPQCSELGNSSSAGSGRDARAVPRTESGTGWEVRSQPDESQPASALGNSDDAGSQGRSLSAGGRADQRSAWSPSDFVWCRDGKWRPVEPGSFPLAHGIPNRVGRLRAYGNAIVPQVAAAFIRASMAGLDR